MRNSNLYWFLIALFVVAMDRMSKIWILQNLTLHDVVSVFPHFNLILAYNRGAAFSFLATAGDWQNVLFGLFAILICLIVIVVMLRMREMTKVVLFSLALILGGAWGNVLDRIEFGHVVDFLDFYIGNLHYATFNLADSAICVGTFLLIVDAIFLQKNKL